MTGLHFANARFAYFLPAALAGCALTILFYLKGKRPEPKPVSSLQFWLALAEPPDSKGRARLGRVGSLLLQLTYLLLLLAAMAGLEWRGEGNRGKQHVLLIDDSAWTQQRNSHGEILEQEKTWVRDFLDHLPSQDEVMLATVNDAVEPRSPLTKDRISLEETVSGLRPVPAGLDGRQVLAFARQARDLSLAGVADVVYVGPGLAGTGLAGTGDAAPGDGATLRSHLIEASTEHCGLSHIGLERSASAPGTWNMIVTIRNYGRHACDPKLAIGLAEQSLPPRALSVSPGGQEQQAYHFASTRGERLTASLMPRDSLAADQRVGVQLPPAPQTRIALYTNRPELFSRLAKLIPNASVSLRLAADYEPAPRDIDLIILDGLSPAAVPRVPSLWVRPASAASYFPLQQEVVHPAGFRWNRLSKVAAGLYSQELPVPAAAVYRLTQGDVPVLSVADGPVVMIRSGGPDAQRSAVLGFDPTSVKARYQLTTPLLWLNLVQWLAAGKPAAGRIEVSEAGDDALRLEEGGSPEDLTFVAADGGHKQIGGVIVNDRQAQLFAAGAAIVHFSDQGSQVERRKVLPQLSSGVQLPKFAGEDPWLPTHRRWLQLDAWRWLVVAGLVFAGAEAFLFGGLPLFVGGRGVLRRDEGRL